MRPNETETRLRPGFKGRRETRGFVPKTVEVGKESEPEIQELSRRKEGIIRIEGLVVFVPNAKQGEHVKIKITRIGGRFAETEVVEEGKAQSEEEKKGN